MPDGIHRALQKKCPNNYGLYYNSKVTINAPDFFIDIIWFFPENVIQFLVTCSLIIFFLTENKKFAYYNCGEL